MSAAAPLSTDNAISSARAAISGLGDELVELKPGTRDAKGEALFACNDLDARPGSSPLKAAPSNAALSCATAVDSSRPDTGANEPGTAASSESKAASRSRPWV